MRPDLSHGRGIVGAMETTKFELTDPEREELAARLRSRTLPAEDVRRARLILMLADGESFTVIQFALNCDRSYISRWERAFSTRRTCGFVLAAPRPCDRTGCDEVGSEDSGKNAR